MSYPSVADQVERVLKPIQQFTRGWMLVPSTPARGVELGLPPGEAFWIIGRAGVMGDVTAEVAAAGLAFLAPAYVTQAWNGIPDGHTPSSIAAEYAALVGQWGEQELARFDAARMARLDELGRRVADAAPGALGAVFAGTRALPIPSDVGARVALTTHVLREMRGAAHIVALQACGLTPLEAVLVSPAPHPRSGPVWAEHLGWTGPFPDATDEMRAARSEAERLTSKIVSRYFATLGDADLDEFAELVETTRNSIDM